MCEIKLIVCLLHFKINKISQEINTDYLCCNEALIQ